MSCVRVSINSKMNVIAFMLISTWEWCTMNSTIADHYHLLYAKWWKENHKIRWNAHPHALCEFSVDPNEISLSIKREMLMPKIIISLLQMLFAMSIQSGWFILFVFSIGLPGKKIHFKQKGFVEGRISHWLLQINQNKKKQ